MDAVGGGHRPVELNLVKELLAVAVVESARKGNMAEGVGGGRQPAALESVRDHHVVLPGVGKAARQQS
jgi:hypothetical protein